MLRSERIRAQRAGEGNEERLVDRVFRSRKSLLAAYVLIALVVSALIAGAVTYLRTYDGTDPGSAVMSEPIAVDSSATEAPVETAAPTPVIILVSAPGGGWTDESCTSAGAQMQAQMASFWTTPQGSGCNVLIQDQWITLP